MNTTNTQFLIHNAIVLGPAGEEQHGWLLTRGEKIQAVGFGKTPELDPGVLTRKIDARGRKLLPGFIDLHVHGAVGHEVMDGSPEELREMACFYAKHGVTTFLATTWTARRENILAALHTIANVTGSRTGGATLAGAHLEGPYLNPEKCGAQDARLIRRAEREEAMQFLESGPVRLLALAPEFPENAWLIDECVRQGITVAAAHTTATLEQMEAAVERGLSQVTHCFNGMQGLGHRDLGTVGAALSMPQLNCELIADNIHVHPRAQKILVQVKGPERTILITDAIRGTGLADGEYRIDDRTVTIRNGEVRLPGGSLAGSVLTMEKALRNVIQATGIPLREAWKMSSLNAARAIGLSAQKGSIETGKDADLVLMDDDYQVLMTLVEGEIVFEAS
jgi:N-acetylglucosamine-6-phosphate deacetylase